jgi:hypothetical protein
VASSGSRRLSAGVRLHAQRPAGPASVRALVELGAALHQHAEPRPHAEDVGDAPQSARLLGVGERHPDVSKLEQGERAEPGNRRRGVVEELLGSLQRGVASAVSSRRAAFRAATASTSSATTDLAADRRLRPQQLRPRMRPRRDGRRRR